jgi:hypothetical protein
MVLMGLGTTVRFVVWEGYRPYVELAFAEFAFVLALACFVCIRKCNYRSEFLRNASVVISFAALFGVYPLLTVFFVVILGRRF